jgi:uncharacterized protein
MTPIFKTVRSMMAVAFLICWTGLIGPAYAITLDEARAQGFVGERPDGLVAAVSANVSSEIAALIDEINAARLSNFRQLAAKDVAPLGAVQAIAGEKLVKKARQNGWYVMDASGAWSR